MELRTYPEDSIIARVDKLAREAADKHKILTGVDLTQAEYEQLQEELEYPEEAIVAYVPPHNLPIYVNGESMLEKAQQRQALMLSGSGRPQ